MRQIPNNEKITKYAFDPPQKSDHLRYLSHFSTDFDEILHRLLLHNIETGSDPTKGLRDLDRNYGQKCSLRNTFVIIASY